MRALIAILAAVVTWASGAVAHAGGLAPDELREIGIDQKLDNPIPTELVFRNEHGERVTIGDYFDGERPVILALVYQACPMLCSQVLRGVAGSLKPLPLEPGEDYRVLAVSFDPNESPEAALLSEQALLKRWGRDDAADHVAFLTGDEEPIRQLTDAVGFRYTYDEELQQYAHASAIMILTPDGRVARYFFGSEYPPEDLRLGIVEASEGKVGGITEELLLLCYRYDPATGTYSASAIGAIRIGGVLTMLGLGAFIGLSLIRERRRKDEEPNDDGAAADVAGGGEEGPA